MRAIESMQEQVGPFTVRLELFEEQGGVLEPWGVEESAETKAGLDSGKLIRFRASVTVFCEGIELAQDNLGNCIYDSEEPMADFLKAQTDGYYADMKQTALHDAQNRIDRLAAHARGNSTLKFCTQSSTRLSGGTSK